MDLGTIFGGFGAFWAEFGTLEKGSEKIAKMGAAKACEFLQVPAGKRAGAPLEPSISIGQGYGTGLRHSTSCRKGTVADLCW